MGRSPRTVAMHGAAAAALLFLLATLATGAAHQDLQEEPLCEVGSACSGSEVDEDSSLLSLRPRLTDLSTANGTERGPPFACRKRGATCCPMKHCCKGNVCRAGRCVSESPLPPLCGKEGAPCLGCRACCSGYACHHGKCTGRGSDPGCPKPLGNRRRFNHAVASSVAPAPAGEQSLFETSRLQARGAGGDRAAGAGRTGPSCGGLGAGAGTDPWAGDINVYASDPQFQPLAARWAADELWNLNDDKLKEKYIDLWGTFDANGGGFYSNGERITFNYLETYQIIVNPGATVTFHVWPQNIDTSVWTHYLLYRRNEYWGMFALDYSVEQQVTVSEDEPAQFTMVVCTDNGEVYEGSSYSILISARAMDPASDVWISIQGNLGYEDAKDEGTWDQAILDGKIQGSDTSMFARPMWHFGGGWLGYYGSLVRLKGFSGTVDITLGDGVTTDIPLTSSSWVCMQVQPGFSNIRTVSPKQQSAMENYLMNVLDGAFLSDDRSDPVLDELVEWDFDVSNCAKGENIGGKVYIRGYGIINGFNLAGRDSWGGTFPEYDKSWQGTKTLKYLLSFIEYQILSGLVEISSAEQSSYASVEVSNVMVAYPPKRYTSSMQVNSAYYPMYNYDNNQGAVLFDVKIAGNWLDASDGPEVMGGRNYDQKAYLNYCYFQVADDTLKMSVSFWKAEQITVLQGNTGGVFNVGSYGFTRDGLVKGMSATGIWVHRITQSYGQYDGKGGMITSRTAPTGVEIRDTTISDVWIPSLGGAKNPGGTYGPNCVYRLFGLGVDPAGDFAASVKTPRPTGFNNLQLIRVWSDIEPLDNNLFYNINEDDKQGGQMYGYMTASFVYCQCPPWAVDADNTCSSTDPCAENTNFNPYSFDNLKWSAWHVRKSDNFDYWYSVNGFFDGTKVFDSDYEASQGTSGGDPDNNVGFFPDPNTNPPGDCCSSWTFNYAAV